MRNCYMLSSNCLIETPQSGSRRRIDEQSLVAAFYDGDAERLERRYRMVYSSRGVPALAPGRSGAFPRLPLRVVARHVALVWPRDTDVFVLHRPVVESPVRGFPAASLDRRSFAGDRAPANRVLLGSYSGIDGDTGWDVSAEVPTTDEHSLVAGVVFSGLRRIDDLFGGSHPVANAASESLTLNENEFG